MTQSHKEGPGELGPHLASEGRWKLLKELKAVQGKGDWEPITVGLEELTADVPWVFNGGERVITFSFDSRVSYRSVVSALAQLWPEMTKLGWVTPTRELNELSLSLLRHVCLGHPHAAWQDRLDAWNEQFPDWRFKDRRALISRFHRAEESLTGTRDGLKQFYATAGPDLVRSTFAGMPEQMIDALTRRAEARGLGESDA